MVQRAVNELLAFLSGGIEVILPVSNVAMSLTSEG